MVTPQWLNELFAVIDARDATAFSSFLTEDVAFRFGNAEVVRGRDAVQEAVAGFFTSIEALSHTVRESWFNDSVVTCHGEVTYTRHDGSQLTVPFANVMRLEGERIGEYLIFGDMSQLYA